MPRTPFRTPVEDFIVTPGDVVRGEDQAAGGDVIVRGGSSTGGGNPGGDLSLTGGAGNAAGGGGTVLVMGGTAGPTGAGGGVTLQGSNAGMGIGGYVLLTGGNGAGGGERGTVRVTNTALEFVEAVSVPGGVTVAARGRVWVRNDVPNVLIFTDGAGVDTVLGGAATLASVVASVGVSPSLQSAPFVWQIADTESLTFEGVTANEDLLVLAHMSGADVVTLGHGVGDRLNALSATNNFFFGAVFDSASVGPPLQGIQVGVTTNTIDSLASGTTFLIRGLDVGAGGTAGEITLRGGNKAAGVASDGGAASLLGGSTAATGLSAGGAVKVTGGEATGGDATSVGGAVTITGGQNLSSTAGAVTVSGGMGDTGGSLLVQAGEGGTVAGTATLRGGAASAGALIPGGDITVIGGAGDSDDIGGAVFITGGPAGAGNSVGPGAAVTITGGSGGTASGDGGHVSILGGAPGAAASDGGNIFLTPSLGTGVGVDGEVFITGKLNVSGGIDPTYLGLNEQAVQPFTAAPGIGYLWVRSDTPSTLVYTDDDGTQFDLVRDGSGPLVVIDRALTDLTVTGTSVETAIYSVSLPANTLGPNGLMHVRLVGTFLTTTLITTFIVRVKFGGTTIYQDTSPTVAISATARGLDMDLVLVNRGATGSQVGGGNLNLGDSGAATVGIGNFAATDTGNATVRFATSTIDTTVAQTFEITIQHASSAATVTTTRNLAFAVVSKGS